MAVNLLCAAVVCTMLTMLRPKPAPAAADAAQAPEGRVTPTQ
ncbi:hypothetical protein [Streptomyces sp. CA-179760]